MVQNETMMSNEILLSANSICKYFKLKGKIFKAVDEASFFITPGIICGFVGPNGAGKTTTIKMIVGATFPTKGEIFILGHRVSSLEAKKFLGYIPEKFVFYDDMLPREYLIYLANLSGIEGKEARARADELLKMLELYEHRHKKIKNFSSGMKQKLNLAQAIIHQPRLLILDEPTANLDPPAKKQFFEILKELVAERKISILISSHHLEELERVIDKVVIINKGKILLDSFMKDLSLEDRIEIACSNPQKIMYLIRRNLNLPVWFENGKIFINVGGYNSEEIRKELSKLIIGSGEAIIEITTKKESLDKLFFKLVGDGK